MTPTPDLKIILMGTGPFAVPSFDAIRLAGHPIPLVVTRPQPPVKSRRGPPPAPVRHWAQQHQLPIYDPISINDEEAVGRLTEKDADLLVVCDYGQILKPPALASVRLGGINLHGSLLPKYRGAAPVQWALLSGDDVTGVSVIHMTPRLDGGPILCTRQTPIRDDETAGQLETRLSEIGVEATLESIGQLADWDGVKTIGQPQDASRATKAPRLQKGDGEIDWNRTAQEIDCHIRGMQPWPLAFTLLPSANDKPPLRLAIKAIAITDRESANVQPGQILAGDELCVATADKIVRIERLQPAGKKEMSGIDFLRGHPAIDGRSLH